MPRRPRRAGPEQSESDESEQDSQLTVTPPPLADYDFDELERMQRENEDDHVSDK